MNELKTTGKLTFDADGDQVELLEEDLLIDAAQMPGYVSDTEYETTVVLDTNLTPELVEEGFVREIISNKYCLASISLSIVRNGSFLSLFNFTLFCSK